MQQVWTASTGLCRQIGASLWALSWLSFSRFSLLNLQDSRSCVRGSGAMCHLSFPYRTLLLGLADGVADFITAARAPWNEEKRGEVCVLKLKREANCSALWRLIETARGALGK